MLFFGSAGLHRKKAMPTFEGNNLESQGRHREARNASVTEGDKSVWKVNEAGNFESECCQEGGGRGNRGSSVRELVRPGRGEWSAIFNKP